MENKRKVPVTIQYAPQIGHVAVQVTHVQNFKFKNSFWQPQCLISELPNHPTKLSPLQNLTQQQPKDFRRRLLS